MTGNLFETRTDAEMRRDAITANEARVHDVLTGGGRWPLTERQHRLLECLRGRQGRLQAISISDLVARIGGDPRSIKSDVRELVVTFGLAIVSSRDGENGGYFFAVTAEERISGTADYVKEIVALAERVRIVRNVHDLRTMLGQIGNELGLDAGREAR